MTVIIDQPRWPAHGTDWSHLVSDTSLEELHAFAERARIPHRSFDRDHYDVPAERYDEVVAAGAVPVSNRELVLRLRASGLRVTQRERRGPPPAAEPPAAQHYVETNRSNWDERVDGHLVAYRAADFAADPTAISQVVREDVELMRPFLPGGSPDGLDLVHLQCHIGTDTLSWARLGSRVTGIDFSDAAVVAASSLANAAGLPATFLRSTVDEALAATSNRFDVVYTSIGVLPWLPDLGAWARTIHGLLRPGGVFFVRDGHPMMNSVDWDSPDDRLTLAQPYFATEVPLRYDDGTSYADDAMRLRNSTTFEWSHPLSEIIGSLLSVGLELTSFEEHRSIPWKALSVLEEQEGGRFVLPEGTNRLPLTFSITARRPA